MLSRKTPLSTSATLSAVTGVLDAGSEFEGRLTFQGTLRIGGTFKGQIFTPDTLIIGEGAKVSGEIDAGIVIISGEVQANIKARHRVEVHSPAVFRGSIVTPSLQVEEGVIFEGSSKMINTPSAPIPTASRSL